MNTKNHKLAAIVFTDIVGYTKQMEENETRTMQLLQQQREIIFPIVNAHGGKVVKELGDGLLIMFHSAIEAVKFAIETQDRLKDEELTIRAGIHIGDVIFEEGDVFGSAVNTAARIEPLAPPNGICISEDVRNQIRNKKDIQTISIGKKELKGVNETLEIFKIAIGEDSQEESAEKSHFFIDLWKRKVIHILGAYIISSLFIIYIISTIASSLLLSPHLVDFSWITLLSLSPTVFILSYFHARKSRGKWALTEKIGLPVNLIFSALLLIIVFKGKDLGAATKALTIENEDGEKIERVVVKSEFRKKIAIFFFENESKDTTLNWMQYGISSLINYDLSQDIFLHTLSGFDFYYKLNEYGFSKGIGIPLTLEKKIANYYHLKSFISGSFNKHNDEYSIKVNLYNTNSGALISENVSSGENIFTMIDEITRQIKIDLEIPESPSGEVNDLPISEIFTESSNALKNYVKGLCEIEFYNNLLDGINYFEIAVANDPNFTLAHLSSASAYFHTNQVEKSKISLKKIMQQLYKLPETRQFAAKSFYYTLESEPEKALAVLKMWVELFPDDINGHLELADRYVHINKIPEVIEELKTILELDPEQYVYLEAIGDFYVRIGNFEEALNYYQQYEKQFPKDYNSYRNIGYLYFEMGDFKKAKSYYEKALLLETEKVSLLMNLIRVEIRLGNFHEALTQNLNTLKKCNTPSDSMRVYSSLENYFEIRGQIVESIKYMELKLKESEKNKTPVQFLAETAFNANKYVIVGNKEKAFQILNRVEEEFEPPIDDIVYFGYMLVYLELEDIEKAEEAIIKTQQFVNSFGQGELQHLVYTGQGRIHELKGEYELAIENFRKGVEISPHRKKFFYYIGRCYRKLNRFTEAKENLIIAYNDFPYNPLYIYELALLNLDLGNTDKAIEYLEKANEIWKDADSNYKPAQKAKAKLEEVNQLN
jgi:class 3 adenylate cyclase/tetratricopeptide (TPR) repeat protein